MWARVKGKTQNDLQKLPFAGVYRFQAGVIQPLHGIKSRTYSCRLLYIVMKTLLPLVRALIPNFSLTTEEMGKAMLKAARQGSGRVVLEAKDIALLARSPGAMKPSHGCPSVLESARMGCTDRRRSRR
jgi:hypothetical protein